MSKLKNVGTLYQDARGNVWLLQKQALPKRKGEFAFWTGERVVVNPIGAALSYREQQKHEVINKILSHNDASLADTTTGLPTNKEIATERDLRGFDTFEFDLGASWMRAKIEGQPLGKIGTWKVKFKPNHSDEVKTITVERMSRDEAADYAAMFFNADQILEVKELVECVTFHCSECNGIDGHKRTCSEYIEL